MGPKLVLKTWVNQGDIASFEGIEWDPMKKNKDSYKQPKEK